MVRSRNRRLHAPRWGGTRGVVDRSHTYAISLFGRAINPVDHRCRQAPLKWFRLTRPIRVSASYHYSPISACYRYQFLWIRFPPLDIQHTITDVLKIDE